MRPHCELAFNQSYESQPMTYSGKDNNSLNFSLVGDEIPAQKSSCCARTGRFQCSLATSRTVFLIFRKAGACHQNWRYNDARITGLFGAFNGSSGSLWQHDLNSK
jgi:hypothetical protein